MDFNNINNEIIAMLGTFNPLVAKAVAEAYQKPGSNARICAWFPSGGKIWDKGSRDGMITAASIRVEASLDFPSAIFIGYITNMDITGEARYEVSNDIGGSIMQKQPGFQADKMFIMANYFDFGVPFQLDGWLFAYDGPTP